MTAMSLNDHGVDYHLCGNLTAAAKCYEGAIQMQCVTRTTVKSKRKHQSSNERQQLDMPEPLPESSICHDSSLIGMGRFVTPLKTNFHHVDECTNSYDAATAMMLYNLSLLKMSQSQFVLAKDLLEVALMDLNRNVDDDVDEETPLFARLRLMILTNLGMSLYRLGRYDEAADRFEDACALPVLLLQDAQQAQAQHEVYLGHSPRYANMLLRALFFSLLNCARALDAAGGHRSHEALGMVRDAGGLCETIGSCSENKGCGGGSSSGSAAPPSETECTDLLSGAAYVEAVIYHTRGKHEHAEASYRQCIERSSSRSSGPDHQQSSSTAALIAAAAYDGLGHSLFDRRHLSASVTPLRTSWSLRSSHLGEGHADSIDSLYALGRSLHDLEQMVDALAVYERTYRLQSKALGPGHVDSLRTACNVARIHRTCGNGAAALEACDTAIVGGRESLGGSHPFVLDMVATKGVVLHEMGRTEEASKVLMDVVQWTTDASGSSNPAVFKDHLAKCFGGR
eukprot:CAMPEP_0113574540 /NCGR_PEP_ID=MMETSP0015_2-20120614/27201_1 /TAXON_ID=2838 /ORGANISM="Odontella" /LENGTH=510 /DNA_ID=CAMNT_0000477683 /DNA_START=192 /DNA_END=1720 /DNA_ORIENTATION=+ /assembly_acc=CAM_ASM_000160